MCYAVDKEEWIDQRLEKSQIEFLEGQAKELLQETIHKYPHVANKADFFAMETCLCSFKKLFRKSRGRYLGFYLDRQAEEIKQVEKDSWDGIDWTPMWQAREETIEKRWLNNKIEKYKMEWFLDTGKFEQTSFGLEEFFV